MSDTYQTNGLVDLIGRRAMWGKERVRIVEVSLIEEVGAVATVVKVGRERRHNVRVDRLRLVPVDNLPKEERVPQTYQAGGPPEDEEDEDEYDPFAEDSDDEEDDDDLDDDDADDDDDDLDDDEAEDDEEEQA
jgi:hypothetical protein